METNHFLQQERFLSKSSLKKVFLAGLIVGTLDILSAFVDYYISTGKNPLIIFKMISSGVLGKDALTGGFGTLLFGLLLHFVIAFSFTFLFWWLYCRIKLLSRNKIITGIVYGIFIWAVMNFIVVPLSQTPRGPFNLFNSIKAMLILICMIGLPLSFLANCFLNVKNEK